ncbi:MAG: RNA polymerase sigma factor [Phycisphaeraceae bacterium]|nr:RNA polymerase sigma factor [Phycisphaeraceae bacterium]
MIEIATETIKTCQEGNTAAFAEIVRVFERPLFAFVYRLHCAPPGRDVEDVVQEIFVKAYQNIHHYHISDNGSFTTWLFALARNLCVSLMRRKKLETQTFRNHNPKWPYTQSASEPCPSEALANLETIGQITQAVAELPETQQSAFILRHYHDMAYKDIAEILECNEGTIRSRLSRARQSIAQTLQITQPSPAARRPNHE